MTEAVKRVFSDEHRLKLKYEKTEEHRLKLKAAAIGKKHNENTKATISNTMKANKNASKTVMVNGVEYTSLTEAAKGEGVTYYQMRKQILDVFVKEVYYK